MGVGFWLLEKRLPFLVQERAALVLEEHFSGKVEFGCSSVSLFPQIRIAGENLVFHHTGRTDVPPLHSSAETRGSVANIPGQKATTISLDSSQNNQDDDDEHHQPDASAGVIAPAAAVRPSGKGAYEEQDQNDNQNCSHAFLL
jgi:hypothetical protein